MITGAQVKAARVLLGWSQDDLGGHAGVSAKTVSVFEHGLRPSKSLVVAIRAALEAVGVEFTNGGQPGVKLKAKPAKGAVSDEAAIADDPEGRGDPYMGSPK